MNVAAVYGAEASAPEARIEELERELRRTKRELNSARAQIERYKVSVRGKDQMSRVLSADKARRELYLNNLLRVMPEIVLFANVDLEVVMCSDSYLAAAGLTSYDQIIGTPAIPDHLEYPEGQTIESARQQLIDTMLRKELTEEEIYFSFLPDREKRYYKKYTLPICDAADQPVGAILLFIDVTDISQARENARNASLAKSNFLANMSHEIRTPMNAIIGMTQIARGSDDPKQMDYCLGKIQSASVHLLGVINDILDMSKIEANKMTVSPEEFDFEKMILRVTGVMGYAMEEKKQTLQLRLGQGIPRYLVSDDQRLSQVITNLLSNAVKFTPQRGEISLLVDIAEEAEEHYLLHIEVRDTGIGITQEQMSRLFHSFEQADAGTSRKYGGTGLGLAISRKIVEMLGGQIWVTSEPGRGSRFQFTVKAGKSSRSESEEPGRQLAGARILVADDSPNVLEYFKGLSERYAFAACDTADTAEALEAIPARGDGRYDMAFVDSGMVEADSFALLRRLKEADLADTLTLMIPATDMGEREVGARQAGADQIIAKPLLPSTIVDLINRCLGNSCCGDGADDEDYFDFTGCRVLLAEDIEINQEILITLLGPTGIEIRCAEDGARALDMFRTAPEDYDLILMDVHMPEMDGYEATRRIRALSLEQAAKVPIIAMTANVFREDIERCLQAGMNDHIGKPVNIDEVAQKLRRYLPARKGRNE